MGELPNNWSLIPIGDVVISKKGKKPTLVIEEEQGGFLPYLLIHEIEGGKIRGYTNDPKVPVADKSDVLLVWDGSIGKCSSGHFGAIGSTLVCITPLKEIPTKYIEYFIKSKKSYILQNSTGTGLQHINKNFFKECLIPVPPLTEQKRIVAKLDVLFGELEALKGRLSNIPQLLKNFRQAVLTQAVTGKLTAEWRVGKDLGEWQEVELDKVCESSFYGPRFSKEDYAEDGFPTVRTSDMTDDGYLEIKNDTPRIPLDDQKKIDLYKVCDGDLLVTRTGSIGKMARYVGTEIVIPSAYLIRFRFTKEVLTDFVYYCLRSPFGQSVMGLSSTSITQPNLNAKKIRAIKIPSITIIEQEEIVRRVENLFAQANAIETKYEALTEYITKLPQAILAKAFRGELVEQLDSDGSAAELLEEIKALKASLKPVKKTRTKKSA